MLRVLLILAVALMVGLFVPPAGASAQQGPAGQEAQNITLVYEREIYTYQGADRRDPFMPLTGANQLGPRFESLALQGIIYSTGQGRSVALITDGEGRVYRLRVGDMVGSSRVIEIGPARVVMAVENFGTTRQEILELPSREGTDR